MRSSSGRDIRGFGRWVGRLLTVGAGAACTRDVYGQLSRGGGSATSSVTKSSQATAASTSSTGSSSSTGVTTGAGAGIACGSVGVCNAPSECCVQPGVGAKSCSASCPGGETLFECTGSSDCAGNEVCCWLGGSIVACDQTEKCKMMGAGKLCNSPGDCDAGTSCQASTTFPGFSECQ